MDDNRFDVNRLIQESEFAVYTALEFFSKELDGTPILEEIPINKHTTTETETLELTVHDISTSVTLFYNSNFRVLIQVTLMVDSDPFTLACYLTMNDLVEDEIGYPLLESYLTQFGLHQFTTSLLRN